MKRFIYILILFLFAGAAFAALEVESKMIGRQENVPCIFLRLTVRNPSSQKLGFDVTLKDSYTNSSILIRNQEISPLKEQVFNLAVPLMKSPLAEVVDSEGGKTFAASSWDFKIFLNICDISNFATEKQATDFSTIYYKTSANAVSQLEPDILPDNWLCYTPFLSVFIREDAYNSLEPPEKEAILQWVDAGGCLIVYGSDQNREVNRMLGTIRYQSASPLELNDLGKKIAWSPWLDQSKTRGSMKDFPYQVKKSAGKYGGFILTTAFLIMAGPLNYSFWKKRKRIRMILITLPVISISFCVIIILYFIASQGFAKKGGSVSVTILDENTDTGVTFSRNCLFSGLYPLGGFRFDRTTGFYPFIQTKDFSIDFTKFLHLKSGIFTPSVNFHYLTAMPFKTRERFVYDPEEKTITNGLEQNVEGLLWKEGGQILVARDIAPGQKKKLEPFPQNGSASAVPFSHESFSSEFLSESEAKFGASFLSNFISAPLKDNRVKYIARIKDNPPSIQTGIKISAKKNTAFLAGLE